MTIENEDRSDVTDRPDESAPERVRRRHRVASALSDRDFGDVLVLSTESARRALTPTRREIVEALATTNVESQRELAEVLDRDPGNVKRDLAVLIDEGVVAREKEGRAFRPYLTCDAVVQEPVPVTDPD